MMSSNFLRLRPFKLKIGTLVLAWVLVPLICLGAASVISLIDASKNAQQVQQMQGTYRETAQKLAILSNELGSGLIFTYQAMSDLRETHQENIEKGEFDPIAETTLRKALRDGVRGYLSDTIRFISLTQTIDLHDPDLKANINGISRYALQADRLVSLYIVSNSRTLRFLQSGGQDGVNAAQNNYRFEEKFLLNSIQKSLISAAELFKNSSSMVLQYQAEQQESVLMAANLRSKESQFLTLSMTISGIFIVGILAYVGVKKTIISPIRKIPDMVSAMGSEEVGNDKDRKTTRKRQDEIGDVIRAVEDFGQKLNQEKEIEQQGVRERLEHQVSVVEALAQGLMALANGDLSIRIDKEMPADYDALRKHFNAALQDMMTSMSGILDASKTIRTEVTDIVSTSESLSQRNQSQAGSLEEIAAAITELTQTTSSLSISADNILIDARAMHSNAGQCIITVGNNVKAIDEIQSSSLEISKITDLISDIAFQTNILALNASVEAARAGESGLGFSVVASEVRSLAHRTADAVADISGFITQSTGKIQKGHELAGQMNDDLIKMGEMIETVCANISEIAVSVSEQAAGADVINNALSELDKNAQNNAAISEELTANTQVLNSQCSRLTKEVDKFTLESTETTRKSRQQNHAA